MLLHQLLVACAITGLVLGGTYTMLEQGLRTQAIGVARAEAQQSARVALARLSVDIRNAGRGARWTGAAIAIAEPSRVVLASDIDDDGTTSARGELITWQLVGSILRRNAGGGAQPVINGVKAFELRYLDDAGWPTTALLDIRAIDVLLVTTPDGPGSSLARGVASQVTTRVRLRNR